MSNHDVGHAMSLAGEHILELYEAGKISKEACKSIIRAYTNAAGAYDGNSYEALESVVEAGYCGLCFEKFEELGDLFCNNEDINTLDQSKVYRYFYFRDTLRPMDILLHAYVCPECKEKLTREYLKLKQEKKF